MMGEKTLSFQTDPKSALPASLTLTDRWARPVRYLRVSVTDRCNYRCRYCMPEDDWSASRREDILTLEEIARVVRLLAPHGLEKVRITGGEPLLRKNICQLVSWISATPGIRTVAMTTNGHLLERYAQELFDSGLSRLNVSLDTFDAQAFRELTGGGDLERVLAGLTAARTVGFDDIRINAVLTQPPEQLGLEGFVKRCWREGWTPRFIEVMPIGGLPYQVEGRRVTSSDVWTYLEKRLDLNSEFESGASSDGPASYKTMASGPFEGAQVGTISPMSDSGFCGTCNRIRLSARGGLRPCLANDDEVQILQSVRNGISDADLVATVRDALASKLEAHRMADPFFVPLSVMTGLGG